MIGSNVGFGMNRLTSPPMTTYARLPSCSTCTPRWRNARVEVPGEGVERLVVVVVRVDRFEVEVHAVPLRQREVGLSSKYSTTFRALEAASLSYGAASCRSRSPTSSPGRTTTRKLIGSRCDDCGAATFPAQSRCPRCSRHDHGRAACSRSGARSCPGRRRASRRWCPSPATRRARSFEPFGVGLVQLEDVVRVEARLTESDPAKLRFGMDVELDDRPVLRRRATGTRS